MPCWRHERLISWEHLSLFAQLGDRIWSEADFKSLVVVSQKQAPEIMTANHRVLSIQRTSDYLALWYSFNPFRKGSIFFNFCSWLGRYTESIFFNFEWCVVLLATTSQLHFYIFFMSFNEFSPCFILGIFHCLGMKQVCQLLFVKFGHDMRASIPIFQYNFFSDYFAYCFFWQVV